MTPQFRLTEPAIQDIEEIADYIYQSLRIEGRNHAFGATDFQLDLL